MKIITFFLLLEIFYNVSSFDFQDPQQPGVKYVEQNSQVQVTVDEYNGGGKTTIVRIINADKPLYAYQSFPYGYRLEPETKQDPDHPDQYMLGINLVDYETLVEQNIDATFTLSVMDSENTKNVTVNIRNLDDENPILIPPPTECFMEEEVVINVTNSDCVFQVSDADGWLSLMSYKVLTDFNEPIFELRYKTPPADNVYESDVYLVLKDGITLDYENRVGYPLTIEAKDSAGNPTTPNSIITSSVTAVDRAPVWTNFVTFLHIDEETEMSFQVSAIDPDQSAPKTVSYWFATTSPYIDIDRDTGIITVEKIDKDIGITDIFMLLHAYYSVEAFGVVTEGPITFLVDDIDDNVAKIVKNVSTDIKVPENSDKPVLIDVSIEDIDEGENSIYDVYIDATSSIAPFVDVSPGSGYGKITVRITIDIKELRKNEPGVSEFGIKLWTSGDKTPDNKDSLPFVVQFVGNSGVRVGVGWVTAMILSGALLLHGI